MHSKFLDALDLYKTTLQKWMTQKNCSHAPLYQGHSKNGYSLHFRLDGDVHFFDVEAQVPVAELQLAI